MARDSEKIEYEKILLVENTIRLLASDPRIKIIGSQCAGPKHLADLEFIDTVTNYYYVLEAKIPYSRDKYNTPHKLIGQLLAETDKDIAQRKSEKRSKKRPKISQARLEHNGEIRYGALFIYESFNTLQIGKRSGLPTPYHPATSGLDYYSGHFAKLPDAFRKFGETFRVQDILILKLNDDQVWRIDWKDLPDVKSGSVTSVWKRFPEQSKALCSANGQASV